MRNITKGAEKTSPMILIRLCMCMTYQAMELPSQTY